MVAAAPARILVVDDDRNSRESLRRALERDGYSVATAEDGKAALALARSEPFDLVLTDLIMPGLGGMAFLDGLRVICPDVPAILVSAFANVDTAVKAVQRGVSDVLEKPIRLRDVRKAVRRAMEGRLPPARPAALPEPGSPAGDPAAVRAPSSGAAAGAEAAREGAPAAGGLAPAQAAPEAPTERRLGRRSLVGRSPAFLALLDLVSRVGPTPSTVLLLGESGTGKELIAEALHAASPRAGAPLVKVACAALAEGVLEAELFGSERGAYTGSVALRRGRFELAHGGTIFLDEIGDLPLPLQVKLLRVLQEGEFERVGGEQTLHVDVRVLAATHRDLEAEVRAGRFREDLYWRLNVIPVQVPPLRERGDDVLLLAEHMLRTTLEAQARQEPTGFTPEACALLCAYRWPGNVRELENAVERAVALARTCAVRAEDLPASLQRPVSQQRQAAPGHGAHAGSSAPVAGSAQAGSSGAVASSAPSLPDVAPGEAEPSYVHFAVGQTLEHMEREAIRLTLQAVDGNREAAASLLGISLATLYRRLKEMGEEE